LSSLSEYEFGVVNYLVCHPQIIKQIDLDPTWCSALQYQHLVTILQNQNGDFKDAVAVRLAFDQEYPGEIDDLLWGQLHVEITQQKHFNSLLKGLKTRYHQQLLSQYSYDYTKLPTADNLNKLQAQAQLVQCLNQPTITTLTMAEQAKAAEHRLTHTLAAGLKSFSGLDEILGDGLRGGTLWTIGARPGIGKSAFSLNYIQMVLARQPAAYVDHFSLEMTSTENFQRLLAYHTGIPVSRLHNPCSQLKTAEKKQVRAVLPQLAQQHLWLHDKFLVLPEIIKVIREHVQQARQAQQPYVALIDYLQITALTRVRQRLTNRRLEIEAITRELKLLTNELDIPIILFSQLNRELEKRPDRTPQLADLRESGSIEQDSNCVAFLYLDDPVAERNPQRPINLIFRKNRSGRLGELHFTFHTTEMRFEPLYENEPDVQVPMPNGGMLPMKPHIP
jgi:replicative DNA helicase